MSNANKSPEKPLLFGDTKLDAERAFEQSESPFLYESPDPSYVPGYSEAVQANDAAKGQFGTAQKEALYTQFGTGPKELPVNLVWVRVAGLDGNTNSNVQIAAAEWRRRGYRPASVDDLKEHGYSVPPTAFVAPDGTIRRDDVALWIVDGARARALEDYFRRENEDFYSLRDMQGADTGTEIKLLEEKRDRNFTL